jgi:hypothetical protein
VCGVELMIIIKWRDEPNNKVPVKFLQPHDLNANNERFKRER